MSAFEVEQVVLDAIHQRLERQQLRGRGRRTRALPRGQGTKTDRQTDRHTCRREEERQTESKHGERERRRDAKNREKETHFAEEAGVRWGTNDTIQTEKKQADLRYHEAHSHARRVGGFHTPEFPRWPSSAAPHWSPDARAPFARVSALARPPRRARAPRSRTRRETWVRWCRCWCHRDRGPTRRTRRGRRSQRSRRQKRTRPRGARARWQRCAQTSRSPRAAAVAI